MMVRVKAATRKVRVRKTSIVYREHRNMKTNANNNKSISKLPC